MYSSTVLRVQVDLGHVQVDLRHVQVELLHVQVDLGHVIQVDLLRCSRLSVLSVRSCCRVSVTCSLMTLFIRITCPFDVMCPTNSCTRTARVTHGTAGRRF